MKKVFLMIGNGLLICFTVVFGWYMIDNLFWVGGRSVREAKQRDARLTKEIQEHKTGVILVEVLKENDIYLNAYDYIGVKTDENGINYLTHFSAEKPFQWTNEYTKLEWLNKNASVKKGRLTPMWALVVDDSEIKDIKPKKMKVYLGNSDTNYRATSVWGKPVISDAVAIKESEKAYFVTWNYLRITKNSTGLLGCGPLKEYQHYIKNNDWVFKSPPRSSKDKCNQVYPLRFKDE